MAFLELPNAHKLLNETNNHGATPLHYASKNGHSHCIELLLNSGAMVHRSHKGVSPLMLACRDGHIECVKLLYKAHSFQIDWQDDDGETALHYAAHSSSPSMIQKILDLEGKVVHNDGGKSFLDIVIANGNEDCGLAVVNHPRWQECLDVVSPVLEPPMLSLVRKMPNIAKAVLDRCHTQEQSQMKHSETFNFKYLLSSREHEGGSSGQSTTTSTATKRQPPVLAKAKSKQKLLHEVVIENLEAVDSGIKNMTMHRSLSTLAKPVAVATSNRGLSPSMEVLKGMIQHKRVDLLVHPVVSAYLKKKWKSYGRLIYASHIGSLGLLVICLTMFVILGPSPAHRNNLTTYQNGSENPISSEELLSSSNFSENATIDSLENTYITQQAFRWLAVVANSLLAISMIAGFTARGLKSINFIDHIVPWSSSIAIILNFIFLLSPDPFAPKILPFGACACFFTWMVMFAALEFVDVVGVYVNMFFKILRTVFQVLFICFFLLMAFALAMYVIASEVMEFSSVGFSIFSVFGYMLGEVQYSLFIEKAEKDHTRNSEIIIVLIMVLALMLSIVMANLLIGLAVGDIEQIKLNATYKGRALEVGFFTVLDRYAPKCVGQMIAPTSWTIHHMHKIRVTRLFEYLTKMVRNEVLDGPDVSDDEPNHRHAANAPPVDLALEMSEIKQKLQNMSDLLHNLQEGGGCRRMQPWQRPRSTLSIDSRNSMTASDFLDDLA